MRAAVGLVIAIAACEGQAPQRSAPAHVSVVGSPAEPPPPGSDALIAVPPEVAAHVALREVARGLHRPVLVTAAPGDVRDRLFVVEQRGAIRVLEHGQLAARPFFTIGGLSDGEEQGLLGLAFHPKFAQNGKLYVDYTTIDKATHIVEYRVSGRDPDAVDPATAREIITIEHPYSNHNGGNLVFGPDGTLYAGMGDGGSAGDPHGNGQNERALLGKLLRFDVDAPDPKPEIVYLGLRNPWRFWFDRPTGDLYIGDVGQDLWEEVDVVPAGDRARHNFGWNVAEGNHCFGGDECERAGLTPPVVEYPHDQGCSITGGVTYRGKALARVLDGAYFYADYCTGLVRSFRLVRGYVRDHWDWKAAIDRRAVIQHPSSFGVDRDGELYIVLLGGSIYELVPAE